MMRNQRPQVGGGLVLVAARQIARHRMGQPIGVTIGLNGPVTISPVGWAGSTLASGVR